MKKILIFLLLICQVSVAVAQKNSVAEVIGPADFQKEMQQEEVQLIDVRTPEEFEKGHVEGAVNIDFLSENFLEKMSELDKEKPLLIYCRSGNRSGKAAEQLRKAGFRNITDLKGGYVAWKEFIKD